MFYKRKKRVIQSVTIISAIIHALLPASVAYHDHKLCIGVVTQMDHTSDLHQLDYWYEHYDNNNKTPVK